VSIKPHTQKGRTLTEINTNHKSTSFQDWTQQHEGISHTCLQILLQGKNIQTSAGAADNPISS